jgi:hypothetical protein
MPLKISDEVKWLYEGRWLMLETSMEILLVDAQKGEIQERFWLPTTEPVIGNRTLTVYTHGLAGGRMGESGIDYGQVWEMDLITGEVTRQATSDSDEEIDPQQMLTGKTSSQEQAPCKGKRVQRQKKSSSAVGSAIGSSSMLPLAMEIAPMTPIAPWAPAAPAAPLAEPVLPWWMMAGIPQ